MSRHSPITIAVLVSIIAFGFILATAVAIGGSYALTLHYVNSQEAQQQKIQQQQLSASIKSSVPECEELAAMDNARNAGTPAGSYGAALATAIHNFNVQSKCPILLRDVKAHKSDKQILKDLGESGQ